MAATHQGECQICGHTQKLRDQTRTRRVGSRVATWTGKVLVLHGYQRPGHGFIVGDCPGVGYEPYEKSCARIKEFKVQVENALPGEREHLETIKARTTVRFTRYERERAGWGKHRDVPVTRVVGVTEPALLEREYSAWEAEQETRIRQMVGAIEWYGMRIKNWKLRALTLVTKKREPKPLYKDGDKVRRHERTGVVVEAEQYRTASMFGGFRRRPQKFHITVRWDASGALERTPEDRVARVEV